MTLVADPARVVAALAEPSRQTILQRLGEQGAVSASRLAEQLPLTRQALAKHLVALEEAGLVSRSRRGREHVFALRPEALLGTARWLESVADVWQTQLDALKRAAEGVAPAK